MDFKKSIIIRVKERHFSNKKKFNLSRNHKIYTSSNRTPKHMKQKLIKLKEKIDNSSSWRFQYLISSNG